MSFQIHALPPDPFEPLFDLSHTALADIRATKMVVDAKPGYPCRVSLVDAEIGETILLMNYEHQPGDSPYRSTHAIIIRKNVKQAFPDAGTVPEVLASRLISVRAFDNKHYLVDADVVDGSCLSETIPAMLKDSKVAYLHLHNAKPGCFAAQVTRA